MKLIHKCLNHYDGETFFGQVDALFLEKVFKLLAAVRLPIHSVFLADNLQYSFRETGDKVNQYHI